MSEMHNPTHEAELDAEGIPEVQGNIPGVAIDDRQNAVVAPRDYPQGAEEFGTTSREGHLDEPISERVLREEPDRGAEELAASERANEDVGRIVQPESEIGQLDDTKDEVAAGVHEPTTAESAEEAAMHITEAPPMGDDDGYVEDGPYDTGSARG